MEKQLPAVRKLELIPIERRNFPKANRKRKKIQRKRKERDNAARGLVTVTVASMMLNAVMAVITIEHTAVSLQSANRMIVAIFTIIMISPDRIDAI